MSRFSSILLAVIVVGCRGDRGSADTPTDSSRSSQPVESVAPAAGTDVGPGRDFVIDTGGIGRTRLGHTLEDVRRALPGATITRTSDGDGAALVEVTLGPDTALVVYAGEDDADAVIDWTKRVETIEAFGTAFHTVEGVRPGALVADVEKIFGRVTEISVSEIESREYVTFEKQPSWLTLRLNYTGVFATGSRTTTKYEPNAKILSIAVSRH